MTIIEGERLAWILADAYLDGAEVVVELTGKPVILSCLWCERGSAEFPWEDKETGHLHRASEITIKDMKRGDLL